MAPPSLIDTALEAGEPRASSMPTPISSPVSFTSGFDAIETPGRKASHFEENAEVPKSRFSRKTKAGIAFAALAVAGVVAVSVGLSSGGSSTQEGDAENHSVVSFASGTARQCVSWSPTSGTSFDAIKNELSSIKAKGFNCIKSYQSQFGSVQVADAAAAAGVDVVLGVWIKDGQRGGEVASAKAQCGKPNVVAVYVGNEDCGSHGQVLKESFFDVKSACGGKPIGTNQMTHELLNNVCPPEVLGAADYIGANVYSFFSGAARGKGSGSEFAAQINALKGHPVVGPKLHITETGWPSAGGSAAGGDATYDNAKNYFNEVAKMACEGRIPGWIYFSYFMAIDDGNKGGPAFEKSFGLMSAGAQPKWDLGPLLSCSAGAPPPPPPPTPAPTPAPTTAAPTTIAPTTAPATTEPATTFAPTSANITSEASANVTVSAELVSEESTTEEISEGPLPTTEEGPTDSVAQDVQVPDGAQADGVTDALGTDPLGQGDSSTSGASGLTFFSAMTMTVALLFSTLVM